MSLQWWQEVIQTRHHVIWAGIECYVRLSVCTADGLAKLGGVAALPHECLSISRDDMTPR